MPDTIYNESYSFKLMLDNIAVADFMQVSGLRVAVQLSQYEEGGLNERTHKLPGPTRYSPIVLSHGTTDSTDLFDWIKEGIDGTIVRKNGSIVAHDQAGKAIVRWDFKEAWPCGYKGPNFEVLNSEIAIEGLELAHRGFEMKKE